MRAKPNPEMIQAIDAYLSDQQTGGMAFDSLIDRDFLLEDGNASAFFLYYFPFDFLTWEALNVRLIDCLENENERVIWCPGGFGKTTTVLHWINYVCRREPQIAIIYVEKTQPEATKRARALMQIFDGNERQLQHYGPSKGDPWSTDAFTIAQRPRQSQWATVSFFGAGTGGHGGLGSRCNIMLVDDPVTQENSGSEPARARLFQWWSQAASTCPYPLPITNQRYLKKLFLIGTTFHMQDLYHTDIAKSGRPPLHLKAVENMETGTTLAPNRFCYRDEAELNASRTSADAKLREDIKVGRIINLAEFRRKKGTVAFMRRYQNEVTDPDMQTFPELWFRGGTDDWAPPGGYKGCIDKNLTLGADPIPGWRYVTGIDPASGTKTNDTVRFSCATLGYDPENPQYTYLADVDYGQYPFDSDMDGRKTQLSVALDQQFRYNSKIVVESNNIQGGVYDAALRRAASAKGRIISVVGHHTSKQKKLDTDMGIEGMQPMCEGAYLRLPYKETVDRRKVEELISEFVYLGVYGTDDILMSFWFAWRILERYRVQKKTLVADHMPDRPYMQTQETWDFPPHWTENQKRAFMGLPVAEVEDHELAEVV